MRQLKKYFTRIPERSYLNSRVTKSHLKISLLIFLFLLSAAQLTAQSKITSPKEAFGYNVGDDYFLINYSQLVDYWKKLETESPRIKLEVIGKTAEGRPQYMATITSPKNFEKLSEYKEISKKLALAENLTDDEAKRLAKAGKSIVWIDGGLHATEVVGANQIVEMAYQMTSQNDEETLRFLDDIILLLVPANPDGMDLVANWYMRESDPKKRTFNNIPRLYQKYVGHDNNRDFYMINQPETENMSREMFLDWYPQIMYNHHQTGPADLIVFVPPFRDPPNYNYDPLLTIGIQAVGVAMHNRLIAENKPGSGMRNVTGYSIWYNGSLRTIGYFHNEIGMLTEMNGNPTPMEIAFNPERLLPSNDVPLPIVPQEWHFRQSIDYSITLNRAVLDYASRNRETVLYNRYLMGKNSIEKGSRDNWTIHPQIVDMVKEKVKKERESKKDTVQVTGRRGFSTPKKYFDLFRLPENRDPRGYIIPSDQKDFPTAVKFVNALIKSGIKVLTAEKDFQINSKNYPAGSLVIKTAQAFRPHILDMFEPQDHPNDFKFEGGPPIPPYDNAGWTLAYQMGVKFDRILDSFDGPFKTVEGLAKVPAGKVAEVKNTKGFLLRYDSNDAVIAVNRFLKEGANILWLQEELKSDGKNYPAGTIFILNENSAADKIKNLSEQLGLNFEGINFIPSVRSVKMNKTRIGLWDRYGGSMPSGWTRWLLEQFEFPYEVVYPKKLNGGKLSDQFDLLIFVDGAIPPLRGAAQPQQQYGFGQMNFKPESIPEEFRDRLGTVTSDTTIPAIKKFIEEGGTVLAIGSSTNLAYHLALPLSNHMTDSKGLPLPREQYYIPASVMQLKVDNTQPIAFGLSDRVDMIFEESPVFRLNPESVKNGITPIACFDSDRALRSGWAWGQDRLYGGVAAAEAKMGKGNLYLFGPEFLFRGQTHGAFKFLFNGIYLSGIKN